MAGVARGPSVALVTRSRLPSGSKVFQGAESGPLWRMVLRGPCDSHKNEITDDPDESRLRRGGGGRMEAKLKR